MQIDISFVFQAIVITLSGMSILLIFAKYILVKIEASARECRKDVKEHTAFCDDKLEKLHVRINDVREDYMTKEDFHAFAKRMDAELQAISQDIKDNTQHIGTRLDTLMTSIGGRHDT